MDTVIFVTGIDYDLSLFFEFLRSNIVLIQELPYFPQKALLQKQEEHYFVAGQEVVLAANSGSILSNTRRRTVVKGLAMTDTIGLSGFVCLP